MATKIRLQRGGRKSRPIYSTVADARAKLVVVSSIRDIQPEH